MVSPGSPARPHVVEARRLAGDPERRGNARPGRTGCGRAPNGLRVRLSSSAMKLTAVLADDAAAAQHRKADGARRPRAGDPVAPAPGRRRPSSTLRPRAAASPSISAVPEGASTLRRWCASKISTSQSRGPSSAAACSTRPIRTLTPSEKLRGAHDRDASAPPRRWRRPSRRASRSRRSPAPARRCAAARSASAADAAAVVKSIDDVAGGEDGVCASQRAAVDRLARPLGQVAHRPQRRVGRSLDSGDHRPAHAAERAGDADPYRFGHLVLARSLAAQSLRGRTLSQC